VLDDRRWHVDDVPATGNASAGAPAKADPPARGEEGGGALSDSMRAYILGYGGPVTAECTNPLTAAS